jgi:hypothetical protein
MRSKHLLIAGGTAAALVAGAVATTAAVGAPARPDSPASASAFQHPRQNPYYPLRPGTVARYRGSDGPEKFVETVTVTHRTKTIQGVRSRVVRDVLRRVDGTLAERTADWYAADHRGNVWYFGEATATYDESGRLVSREGSWRAGVHGARPGIIMTAHPQPTQAYRQEFLAGHAEDQAWTVQRGVTASVPYGTVHRVVRSFEWSRLEPGVLSEKLYGRGLGIVSERDVAGGTERFSLVSVVHH